MNINPARHRTATLARLAGVKAVFLGLLSLMMVVNPVDNASPTGAVLAAAAGTVSGVLGFGLGLAGLATSRGRGGAGWRQSVRGIACGPAGAALSAYTLTAVVRFYSTG